MSESLSGVTLLAFGGGAPDIFASLSAASGGEIEGVEMGISTLLGSSLHTHPAFPWIILLSTGQ